MWSDEGGCRFVDGDDEEDPAEGVVEMLRGATGSRRHGFGVGVTECDAGRRWCMIWEEDGVERWRRRVTEWRIVEWVSSFLLLFRFLFSLFFSRKREYEESW